MEEFAALAARLGAGIGELRGCLILSRDGLELGAYPPGEDHLVKPAWIRFAQLGDPEKGFVEFGDELWVYVRRGPYAIFAVSGATVRPGLLMDQIDQLLYAAEEARQRREALKIPEAPDAPKSRPRTSLHKEAKAPPSQPAGIKAEPDAPATARDASIGRRTTEPAATSPGAQSSSPRASDPEARQASAPATQAPRGTAPGERPGTAPDERPGARPATPATPRRAGSDDLLARMAALAAASAEEQGDEDLEPDIEVDRVLLAQEFSRLLQDSQPELERKGEADDIS